MTTTYSFSILYVRDPQASAAFYAGLIGRPIVDSAPTFAMLPLAEGVMLGLWRKDGVAPAASAPPGGSEIAFTVEDAAAVDSTCEEWRRKGVSIAQPPTGMDFGYTFTGLDPDGHRLRVFAPGAR